MPFLSPETIWIHPTILHPQEMKADLQQSAGRDGAVAVMSGRSMTLGNWQVFSYALHNQEVALERLLSVLIIRQTCLTLVNLQTFFCWDSLFHAAVGVNPQPAMCGFKLLSSSWTLSS